MYLPFDQACNEQNSETPVSAATIAASQALTAAADAALADANAAWASVISRNWQSFIDLGPQVAFQLRGPSAVDPSTISGSGVALVSAGNANGSNPAAGGAGGASVAAFPAGRGRRGRKDDFLARFGDSPWATYGGPLPVPGSVRSLLYGGQGRPIPVGPGVYAAGTPDPRFGQSCDGFTAPVGVSMLPVGEPSTYAAGGGSANDAASGVGLGLLALVALAGLGYWATVKENKKGARS